MVNIPDILNLSEYTTAFIFLLAEIVAVAIGGFFAFRVVMMGLNWLSVFYEKRNGTYDYYADCTDEDKAAWAAESNDAFVRYKASHKESRSFIASSLLDARRMHKDGQFSRDELREFRGELYASHDRKG